MTRREWAWSAPDGTELRLMRLPDRIAAYLVIVDEHGLRTVARTMGDREAESLAAWLDLAAPQ